MPRQITISSANSCIVFADETGDDLLRAPIVSDLHNDLTHFAEIARLPFIEASRWIGSDQHLTFPVIKASLASVDRSSIILAGAWLEGAISHLAITALLEGFEVFVLGDACVADSERHSELFRTRLIGIGATFTTLRQAIREIRADPEFLHRDALDVLLAADRASQA